MLFYNLFTSSAYQGLIPTEAEQVNPLLAQVSQPFIEDRLHRPLGQKVLELAPDLTGRPFSVTSATYPAMGFAFSDDTIRGI